MKQKWSFNHRASVIFALAMVVSEWWDLQTEAGVLVNLIATVVGSVIYYMVARVFTEIADIIESIIRRR